MSDEIITEEDRKEASGYDTLGPGYFTARRIMDGLLADGEELGWDGLIKKASDGLYETLLDTVQNHLIADARGNVAGHIRRMVEGTVQAIIRGEEWALRQYPLARYHDGATIRRAILKHCGPELLFRTAREDSFGSPLQPQSEKYAEERHAILTEVYRQQRKTSP